MYSQVFPMTVLNPADPVPRYARLAQLLRQRIEKQFWRPGERLPRLEDLMAEFNVARVTARQAVGILAREGWVNVSRGRGTLVQERASQGRTLHLQSSLAELAQAYRNDRPTLSLIDERRTEPPPAAQEWGAPVPVYRHLRRVHSRDQEPYCVISIHLDEDIFRLAPRRFRRETIIPVLLELPEVRIANAHQTLRISVADVETAQLLGMPVNSAVAEVMRVFRDPAQRVIYLAEIAYRADFIRFQMDLKV
jgi:GntR family transcriptional regulator